MSLKKRIFPIRLCKPSYLSFPILLYIGFDEQGFLESNPQAYTFIRSITSEAYRSFVKKFGKSFFFVNFSH